MKYYFIAMSQFDFLRNQVIEEVIRERSNYFINRKDCINFWIVMSPNFLNESEIRKKIVKTNFLKQKKKELDYNQKFYTSVIITTDYEYICWLKLRLGYFENIDENEIVLNDSMRSDGIYGIIQFNSKNEISPFLSTQHNINPMILVENYKQALDTYIKI